MTATSAVPRTTISAAAAKLATVVALSGDDAGTHGLVLVEDEHVVATDGRRIIVIAEPHADGLFSADEREADRVSVEPQRCTTLDDKGKSLRFVPFDTVEEVDGKPAAFPNWRQVVPKPGRVVTPLDPALLCNVVTMHAGKPDEAVVFRGDVGEQEVTLVVMPITAA